jgi:hypothetical protein
MANGYVDPLRGLNPDQSGPREKIQNGDPKASPATDQRSGAREAGGPGPSKQAAFDNGIEPTLHNPEHLVKQSDQVAALPEGVSGDTLPVAALDRAGSGALSHGETLKDLTDTTQGPVVTNVPEDGKTADVRAKTGVDAKGAAQTA